ncbi:MAG: PTS sugar transporter subunit IIA [Deltaproteobacteria bacterium]|nr:PTS sugar transporter subunit IIA [Deltaproteobacteria bacterium]
MIGIVVVTHSGLGEALIEAANCVLEGPLEAATAVSVDLKYSAEELRKKIGAGIKAVDQGDGVIILTDMFGGTPSNLSLSFLEEGRIDVLTGVNLPVLIRAAKKRENSNLGDLAESMQAYGKKSISLASGVLKGNKRS